MNFKPSKITKIINSKSENGERDVRHIASLKLNVFYTSVVIFNVLTFVTKASFVVFNVK